MGRAFPSFVGAVVALVGLLALAGIAPSADGFHQGSATPVSGLIAQETKTLPVDNWAGYTFTVGSGDTIVYQIAAGDRFDVYIVGPDALADYASDTALQFTPYRSIQDTLVAQGTFQVTPAHGTSVTVVIDNVDLTQGGATPTGDLLVTVQLSRTVAPAPFAISPLLIGGIIGIVVLVVVIAIAVAMSRKKALPPPMQPPAAPGYAPGYPQYPQQPTAYQQPPQQGWPPQPPPPPGTP